MKWAREQSEAIQKASVASDQGITGLGLASIREAIELYLADRAPEWRPATALPKRHDLGVFAEQCEKETEEAKKEAEKVEEVADLTKAKLLKIRGRIVEAGKDEGTADSTINRRLAAVGAFLRWLEERDAIDLGGSGVRVGTRAVKVNRELPSVLRPKAIRATLRACLDHDEDLGPRQQPAGPLVLAFLLSGMRFRECLDLVWGEVDWEEAAIELPAHRVKTRQARRIPWKITPALGDLLRALHDGTRGGAPGPFERLAHSTWERMRSRLIDRYGAPETLTAHELRRTCASVLLCAEKIHGDAATFLVARRLGHSVRICERDYARDLVLPDPKAETFEAAAGIEDLVAEIIATVR